MGDIPQTIVSQNDFEVQRACHAILCDMYSMNLVWDGKHDFYEYPDEDALAQVVLMVPPRYWRFAFQDFFGSKISPYVRVLRVLVGVLEQEFVAKVDDPVNFEEEHSELLWALGVYDYVSESWSFLFTTDWVDFIIEHAPRF